MTTADIAPDPQLVAFLGRNGLAAADQTVRWTPLSGGVSSDIWRVDIGARAICIKRALPRLKVAQDWRVPVSRNAYEWAWLTFAASVCPGMVPQPIAQDAELGVFAMQYLEPERHPVWKALLLQGVADSTFASRVGAVLGTLHAASAGRSDIAQAFATDAIFHAIRLEPYLLATAQRHPDLAPRLIELEQRTAACRLAVVHGDVSPKNILVGPAGPVFLDAECAWYGDPAFDVAFCLNHLLLKCVVRRAATNALLECFAAFAIGYLQRVSWEDAQGVEARTATLLPGLLLARVDGKSPVEYLVSDEDRALVRRHARTLLIDAPSRLDAICEYWRAALTR